MVQSKLLITPVQEWVEAQLGLYKTTKVQDSSMIKDPLLRTLTLREPVSILDKEDKTLTTQEFTITREILQRIDTHAKEDQARTEIKIQVQARQQVHS